MRSLFPGLPAPAWPQACLCILIPVHVQLCVCSGKSLWKRNQRCRVFFGTGKKKKKRKAGPSYSWETVNSALNKHILSCSGISLFLYRAKCHYLWLYSNGCWAWVCAQIVKSCVWGMKATSGKHSHEVCRISGSGQAVQVKTQSHALLAGLEHPSNPAKQTAPRAPRQVPAPAGILVHFILQLLQFWRLCKVY